MKHAELRNYKVFLTPDEMDRFQAMLKKLGGKMAPFTRQLVLSALEREEQIQTGRTQIDPAFFQRGME